MVRFWSICRNTFVETIRQPIYGVLILVTFAVLVISLPLTGWTMDIDYHASDQKMLENLGLSTLLVSGLLVAGFSASAVVTREIEDKTALTVISKPVSRSTFVLSKFFGVAGAVTIAFYLSALVFLMTVRHRVMPATADPYDYPVIIIGISAFVLAILGGIGGNYFFSWPFVSAGVWGLLILLSIGMGILSFVGKQWTLVPPGYDTPDKIAIHGQLLVGIALIFMAVMVFVSVAVTASTRLGQVMTLGVCCGVFILGSMHSWVFGYWADEVMAARVLGWIAPQLTYFFPIDALSKDKVIPASYVARSGIYCASYVAGVLAIGMGLFERRQLEAQTASASIPGAVALLGWAGRVAAIAAALVALVMLSLPEHRNFRGISVILAITAGSGINWFLWSRFAAGAKWSYWVVLLLAVIAIPLQGAALISPRTFALDPTGTGRALLAVGEGISAAVLLILLMPKTRRHFK